MNIQSSGLRLALAATVLALLAPLAAQAQNIAVVNVIGPIIATQLLAVVPSWRWVFWVVAITGFLVGVWLWIVLREPAAAPAGASTRGSAARTRSAARGS